MLRQAKSLLDSREPGDDEPATVTVWFNAWQYEKEEPPIVPMVATIVREVERKLEQRKGIARKAAEVIVEDLTKLSRALRAMAYGFSVKAKVPIAGFGELEAGFIAKEMIERYDRLNVQGDPLLDRTLYYNAFEALAGIAAVRASDDATDDPEPPKSGYKIVVFIDDLDRCLPHNGLKVLESIKLVLAQPGFVFVLAVDRRIIERYLQKRYKEEFGVENYDAGGTSYLDKIVQLPLEVPSEKERFERYIENLMEREAGRHPSNRPVCSAILELKNVLALGSGYNPRSLVRFINNLIVDRQIWLSVEPGLEVDASWLGLCAVDRMLRQHLRGDVYEHLVANDPLCQTLLGEKGLAELEPEGVRARNEAELGGRFERLTRGLRVSLDENRFVRELLGTDPGRRWLTEAGNRTKISKFIAAQRKETRAAPATDREIIDRAIRTALGLDEAALVTDEHRGQVVRLVLSNPALANDGLAYLRELTSLRALYLNGCPGITDDGLTHLKELVWLRELYLGGCTWITDEGLAHLEGLGSLQQLSLGGCTRITNRGLAHVRALTALQWLDLRGCGGITDDGLEHLSGLTALHGLDLSGCEGIIDEGLAQLKGMTALQGLYLSGCTRIVDTGIARLAELKSLREVDMRGCTGITESGVDRLRHVLRSCAIRYSNEV